MLGNFEPFKVNFTKESVNIKPSFFIHFKLPILHKSNRMLLSKVILKLLTELNYYKLPKVKHGNRKKKRSSRDHMFYWSIYRWETPINSVWIEVTKRKENWHLGTLGGQNVIMAIPSELEFVLVQVCQMAPILWKLLTIWLN